MGRPDAQYKLGRSKHCDIVIDDIHISSRHATLSRSAAIGSSGYPAVHIVDSSVNGTFVNKERLAKGVRRQLNSGDQVSLVLPGRTANSFAAFVFQQLPRGQSAALLAARRSGSARNVFDYYDVKEELGRGAYARVHKAINRQTGKTVAIKFIDKRRFKLVPGFNVDELLREAEVLKKLHSPYIIELHDVFQTDDELSIVTEFVSGGELYYRVAKKPYKEEDAKRLMKRLFLAVHHLHSRNIVHRDIKPENILLATEKDDTFVKLADFGVAKTLGYDGLKTYVGSPLYFAPEVLRRKNTVHGLGRYGMGADMWSLGVVMYIVLSSMPPFDDDKLARHMENVPFGFTHRRWSGVSEDAKDLIRGLLNSNAEARLTVTEALQHRWLRDVALPRAEVEAALGDSATTVHAGVSDAPAHSSGVGAAQGGAGGAGAASDASASSGGMERKASANSMGTVHTRVSPALASDGGVAALDAVAEAAGEGAGGGVGGEPSTSGAAPQVLQQAVARKAKRGVSSPGRDIRGYFARPQGRGAAAEGGGADGGAGDAPSSPVKPSEAFADGSGRSSIARPSPEKLPPPPADDAVPVALPADADLEDDDAAAAGAAKRGAVKRKRVLSDDSDGKESENGPRPRTRSARRADSGPVTRRRSTRIANRRG